MNDFKYLSNKSFSFISGVFRMFSPNPEDFKIKFEYKCEIITFFVDNKGVSYSFYAWIIGVLYTCMT